jgi:hypothetical protein
MPIITQADLATNIYAEVIDEITRSDSSITDRAISTAVQEAKMYLARFDLVQLFGTDTSDPTVRDEYLNSLIKDLACWHLLRLSNVSADQAVYRTAYEDAIAVLKNIMAGAIQPEGWPYLETGAESVPPGDSISWNSNPKRNNYY